MDSPTFPCTELSFMPAPAERFFGVLRLLRSGKVLTIGGWDTGREWASIICKNLLR